MSGWRDTEGRTAAERQRYRSHQERAEFVATVRHKPFSVLKGLVGFVLMVVLGLALVGVLR